MLEDYARQLTSNDQTNREGHAAKVYFDALFGLEFKRGDDTFINSALNYGYAILLSAFNREIVAQGYSTQLGLNHKNEFNFFNLACDLIEPFRPIVDRFVFDMNGDNFDAEYKHKLCEIFLTSLKINKITYCLSDWISLFVRGVFNALETGDISTIYNYEL